MLTILTGPRCRAEFCWQCLAPYGPIRNDGNHRHGESCWYWRAAETESDDGITSPPPAPSPSPPPSPPPTTSPLPIIRRPCQPIMGVGRQTRSQARRIVWGKMVAHWPSSAERALSRERMQRAAERSDTESEESTDIEMSTGGCCVGAPEHQ